jgi:RecA/RadA recombinase
MGKKTAEPELTRQEVIARTLQNINTTLNAETAKSEWKEYVVLAKDVTSPFLLRRPTGLASLDICLGGGFPAGGSIQIGAKDGVGKNALTLQTLAMNQRIYGKESAVAWCPTEVKFDKPFAHMFGVAVPMSTEEVAQYATAREGLGYPPMSKDELKMCKRSVGTFVVIDQGSTAQRLDAVAQLVQSNAFQIIVIDSVAAILTNQRDDTPLDEFAQQSSEAFLLSEWQKKMYGAYNSGSPRDPNYTTTIMINQVRAKRNRKGPFDRDWEIKGAHALRHAKLGDIVLSRGEILVSTEKQKEDPEDLTARKKVKHQIGKKVRWEIAKGKAGFHEGPKGMVEYHYDTGFYIEKDLVDTAFGLGLIVQVKQGTYALITPDGEVVEEVRGRKGFYEKAYDIEWFDKVYKMILRKADITCLFKL